MGTVIRTIFITCLVGLVIVLVLRWALTFFAKGQSSEATQALPEKSPKQAKASKSAQKKLTPPTAKKIPEKIIDAEIVEAEIVGAEIVEEGEPLCENLAGVSGLVDEIQNDFGGLLAKAKGDKPPTASWDAKDRLELLEAKHGALPPFIQSLFDENDE